MLAPIQLEVSREGCTAVIKLDGQIDWVERFLGYLTIITNTNYPVLGMSVRLPPVRID